ncbi:MAG TPA: mechanosensitive ion channel domain-containing protein [Steroidobacteraceae bacterium]|jgi:small-conductance mechanosensitive channel|nr:mechanosensitive ion channel domain-containing protein [Steroidobacteraceae bacterium]
MRATFSIAVLTAIVMLAAQAAEAPGPAAAPAAESRAVMTGDQVVQILDETVDWYRTLGAQQQAATQPSDLLILYANRQTADKVVALAFEIARANAELLSSEAGLKQEAEEAASSQSLSRLRKKLEEQRAFIQAEMEAARRQFSSAPKPEKATLQSRISVLQGQLDLVNARRNMVSSMSQFASETDATGFGANALKAHIDAIAASIPAASGTPTPVSASTASAAATSGPAATGTSLSRFGIWDLAATVLRLSAKARTIDQIDQRTAELQETFTKIRTPPLEQMKRLADRGDALAAEAETGNANLRGVRDQYDTLAWLFQQTSAIVTPLSKAGVLLNQYRHNLKNWREATDRQYREALEALGLRVLLFAALLAVVFGLAHLWRRAVYRYVHEARRRSRLLLLQKIVLWSLVVAIAASTFATELGSLATFAGLITAGLAVAMQSVLVSIVGYFFLIGKYGIRVGDRVQIGTVTGEVIEMGLVRVHLMELSGEGQLAPTGRVVAFANSIIFQSSGGLFKQIPGVNLAWHEVTFNLPTGADYGALKDEMVKAVTRVIEDYREDMVRQTREIQKAASSHDSGEPQPSVQLRFSAASVDAIVRYPVQLSHAAEIDERVSRELLNVISAHVSAAA